MSGRTPAGSRVSAFPRADEQHEFVLGEDGTRLFVRSRNAQVPSPRARAFLCDGILCDGFIWKYLWEQLPSVVDVVHWNYRGHGRSASPVDGNYVDIEAHAEDLDHVHRRFDDRPAILFGHSMGCQVVLEAWHRHPESVRGVVLLCGSFGNVTSTVRGLPVLDMILPRLMRVAESRPELIRALWSRVPAEIVLKIAFRLGEISAEHVNPADFRPYLEHMTRVDFPLFLRMLRAAGEHSAGGYLGQLNVPTLIVAGAKDTFTPLFLSESMAQAIPGAELMIVPGGTHVAPIEHPELVFERVRSFIEEKVLPLC